MDSKASTLEDLLSAQPDELVSEVQQRIRPRLERANHELILFGAGQLGRITLANLQRMRKAPLAFADNNPMLRDTNLDGVPVFLPQEALARWPNALVVVTVYMNAPVLEQLRRLGVDPITFAELTWCYPEEFLPCSWLELPHKIFSNSDRVRAAAELWTDEVSRAEFLSQIAWRSTLNAAQLPSHSPVEETYFPPDLFDLQPAEVFVDCGAFDGDSIEAFVRRRGDRFRKAIGLEPDPVNRQRFEQRFAKIAPSIAQKIEVLPFAAGERRETLFFNVTGTVASALGRGGYEVQCAPLDELITDPWPTFVKMDIEGAEPAALRGASRCIQDQQPVLAVCLYHAQEHLWELPLLIQSLNPDYRLFLRRYADESWEIVCYAVPKQRCKL